MQLLRQLKLFLTFQPSPRKSNRLTAQEAKQNEEHFKTEAGRKLLDRIESYVSDCVFGACSKYGHEGSYRNGWAMGAHGLRSFILSEFRTPQAQEGTEADEPSGLDG